MIEFQTHRNTWFAGVGKQRDFKRTWWEEGAKVRIVITDIYRTFIRHRPQSLYSKIRW